MVRTPTFIVEDCITSSSRHPFLLSTSTTVRGILKFRPDFNLTKKFIKLDSISVIWCEKCCLSWSRVIGDLWWVWSWCRGISANFICILQGWWDESHIRLDALCPVFNVSKFLIETCDCCIRPSMASKRLVNGEKRTKDGHLGLMNHRMATWWRLRAASFDTYVDWFIEGFHDGYPVGCLLREVINVGLELFCFGIQLSLINIRLGHTSCIGWLEEDHFCWSGIIHPCVVVKSSGLRVKISPNHGLINQPVIVSRKNGEEDWFID